MQDLNRLMVKHTLGDVEPGPEASPGSEARGVKPSPQASPGPEVGNVDRSPQAAPPAGSCTDAEAHLDLQRTSDGFTVSISDSEDVHLSQSQVRRSSFLSTLYDVSSIGDIVPLGLSASLLREWHATVSGSRGGSVCDASLPSLICALEAADFFDDQEAVQRSSLALMRLAFQGDASNPKPRASPNVQHGATRFSAADELSQGACAARLQVLETLPEHLAVQILRTAISAARPDVQCNLNRASCLSPEDMPLARLRQAVLLAIMALLPQHLQHLVLRAHTPAAADQRALSLPLPQLCQAAPIIRALAAAPALQLTSLALVGCSWEGADAVSNGYAKFESTAADAAMRRVFAPLATLSSLLHLRIELKDDWVSSKDRVACVAALGDVVQRLSQLLSLRVRAWSKCGHIAQQLALRLPALRMLCALDLSNNGIAPLHPKDVSLCSLAAVLRVLTTLKHLCLAHNQIGANGWEALAPSVAALPLQSLDLHGCELGDDFTLEAPYGSAAVAEAVAQPTPFSDLCCLRLSCNLFKESMLQFLAHMPRLTELSLTRTKLTVDARLQILRLLHAPDLKVLEIGVSDSNLRHMASPALSVEALGAAMAGCLERHPQLRRLAFGCEDASVLVHALQPLSSLPQLREVDLGEAEFLVEGQPEAVAEVLSRAHQLTSLEMPRLCVKPPVMRPFLRAIGSLSNLRRLELGILRSVIPVSAGCIARGLAPLTQLTRLLLARCRLDTAAAAELAKALCRMPAMHELVLWCDMGVPSVRTVAKALPALRMLSLFVLESSNLGQEGVYELASVLRELRGLRVLRLGRGKYNHQCKQVVAQAAPPGLEHIVFMP